MIHCLKWATCVLVMTPGILASVADLSRATGQDLSSQIGTLGFGRLLLIQRHPVEASHPDTFFYMDYRQGGGLFLVDFP